MSAASRLLASEDMTPPLDMGEGVVLFGGFTGEEVTGDVVEMDPDSFLSETAHSTAGFHTPLGTQHALKQPAPRFAHACVAVSDPGDLRAGAGRARWGCSGG